MDTKRKALYLLFLVSSNLVLETAGYGRYGTCMNGWGAVLGLTPKLMNAGINMLKAELPLGLKIINGKVKIPFNDLPIPVTAKFTNVRIGHFTLTPLQSEFHVANLNVKILSGRITLNIAGTDVTKDMNGVEIDLETSVRSYRNVITNRGIKYDLGLYIKDGNAVRDFKIDASIGTRHFLSDALEVKLKELLGPGSRYHIMSFTIPDPKDDTRRFVPATVDYVFNYDQLRNRNHVFAALMTMPNMTVPTDPRRYIFGNDQLLLPGTQLTLQIENHFLLRFIMDELKKVDTLRHLQLTVTDECPGEITLTRPAKRFSHGADLVAFRIALKYDHLELFFKATKWDATPGVNAHVEYGATLSLTYENGRFHTKVKDEWEKKYTTQDSWLVWIYLLTCGIALAITHILVIPIVKAHIPSVLNIVNKMLSNLQNELHFKVGGIALDRITTSRIKTDKKGNLQFGAVSIIL